MSHKKAARHREFLRKSAQERQAEYETLTTAQKLEHHNRVAPPPHGQRQREKLEAQLQGIKRPLTKTEPVIILSPMESTPIHEDKKDTQ